MSLGFARDSVLNLSSLAADKSSNISESTSSNTRHESSKSFSITNKDNDKLIVVTHYMQESSVQEVPSEANKSPSVKETSFQGHYSGFAVDYAEYQEYGMTYESYPYTGHYFGVKKNKSNGWWCCLMPWMDANRRIEGEEEDKPVEVLSNTSFSDVESVKSDDDISTESALYGERLTGNERAAVMARLRLTNPESSPRSQIINEKGGLLDTAASSPPKHRESDSEEKKEDSVSKIRDLKSILRKGSVASKSIANLLASKKPSDSENGRRRSLFPEQYQISEKVLKHVQFAAMARVVAVKSKNEMSDLQKSLIWWQKQDYEDFKKTSRMIAKAMCEGGSEVWLSSNNAWQSKASRIGSNHRAIHLSDRSAIVKSDEDKKISSDGNKWWHHFGHSRRGLEHIASVEEGRQRQANVRISIRVVIDEQRRQKMYNKVDAEKLRMLSLQYTSWARDLALAAAASDAEAVEVDFSEQRKTREFYILKHARVQGGFHEKLPSFMMPTKMNPQHLDQNTSTQIRIRQKASRIQTPTISRKENAVITIEPIHDASSTMTTSHSISSISSSISKQAAGFGTSNVDVSAILSGMGNVESGSNTLSTMQQPTYVPSVGAH
jgi:hypothetical protein